MLAKNNNFLPFRTDILRAAFKTDSFLLLFPFYILYVCVRHTVVTLSEQQASSGRKSSSLHPCLLYLLDFARVYNCQKMLAGRASECSVDQGSTIVHIVVSLSEPQASSGRESLSLHPCLLYLFYFARVYVRRCWPAVPPNVLLIR